MKSFSTKRFSIYSYLFLCLFAGGCFSLAMGMDYNFDLQNYHLYNPYAFINGRYLLDISPVSVLQNWFNPLLDIPYYLMVSSSLNPYLVTFIQGFYFGALIFVTSLIGNKFFYDKKLVAMATIIGLTSVPILSEIGTTFNDIQSSLLVLFSLYLILRGKHGHFLGQRSCLLSGITLGLASGLKLTAATYCVSMFLTLIVFAKKIGTKKISVWCVGVLGGVLATDGFLAFFLYKNFANPVYPFFNNIFKSSYYNSGAFVDGRFFPKHIMEWIFYPFYWTRLNHLVAELDFIDWRFAVAYVAVFVSVIILYRTKEVSSRVEFLFLAVFVSFSYLLWLNKFSIIRYFIPGAALTGVLVLYPLTFCKKAIFTNGVALIVTFFLIISSHVFSWGRIPIQKFELSSDLTIKNSLVFIAEPTVSIVIPFLDGSNFYVGILEDFFENEIHDRLSNSNKEMYLILRDKGNFTFAQKKLQKYGLTLDEAIAGEISITKEHGGSYSIYHVAKGDRPS